MRGEPVVRALAAEPSERASAQSGGQGAAGAPAAGRFRWETMRPPFTPSVVRVGRFVRVKGDAPEGTALYWGSAAIIDSRVADGCDRVRPDV